MQMIIKFNAYSRMCSDNRVKPMEKGGMLLPHWRIGRDILELWRLATGVTAPPPVVSAARQY